MQLAKYVKVSFLLQFSGKIRAPSQGEEFAEKLSKLQEGRGEWSSFTSYMFTSAKLWAYSPTVLEEDLEEG